MLLMALQFFVRRTASPVGFVRLLVLALREHKVPVPIAAEPTVQRLQLSRFAALFHVFQVLELSKDPLHVQLQRLLSSPSAARPSATVTAAAEAGILSYQCEALLDKLAVIGELLGELPE